MQILPAKYPEHIGLIGHSIINYPNYQEAKNIIEILVANGVDLIELQIPFSEPIADGPLFTKANHEVIENGITLEECYAFIAEMTATYSVPFVVMTYANVAYKQGYNRFVKLSKQAGAKGAIVPDLPLDVATDYLSVCRDQDFAAISVVSPNITTKRLTTLSPLFDGFLYAVARSGVTGSKTEFDDTLVEYLDELRHFTNLPVAVGFGVANATDINFLKGKADYAVIGSQTIRCYEQDKLSGVQKLWEDLGKACGKR